MIPEISKIGIVKVEDRAVDLVELVDRCGEMRLRGYDGVEDATGYELAFRLD